MLRSLLAAAVLALLQAQPAGAQEALGPGGYRWLEDGPPAGPLYMVISLDQQRVHVYDGDRLVGIASVSTGMKGHRTPTGEFPILQKREWHRSNVYSNAPMPFMQRLTWDGIALHAGQNPGYPASHGCIRLPYAFARRLFGMTRLGTLVSVTTDRLGPALMVDAQVIADPDHPGSALVTFTPSSPRQLASQPGVPPPAAAPQPVSAYGLPVQWAVNEVKPPEQANPMLAIDPAIFRPHLRRR
nr:L,D-transpeptidase family protein [Sphingobium sp. Sx8-8]